MLCQRKRLLETVILSCKENEDRAWIVDILLQSTMSRVSARWKIVNTAKATAARIVNAATASALVQIGLPVRFDPEDFNCG